MFEQAGINALYQSQRATLEKLAALEDALNERFYGMPSTIHCMMLSALTGEAMVMIGPPGTAKSRLIRTFCNLTGLIDDADAQSKHNGSGTAKKDERYFEYLLTQFTEPSELFGYFDLAKLFREQDREFVRDGSGMMQKAEVVFLDEVFNASSAILNALLTFMNEKKFHDRGEVEKVPLQLLFAATNHPPREQGLGAVYDRFLLRSRVRNVEESADELSNLVNAAWNETHNPPTSKSTNVTYGTLLPELKEYRNKVNDLTSGQKLRIDEGHILFAKLADLVSELRRKDLSEMSNRRLVKFAGVILAQTLLRAARTGETTPRVMPEDLEVLLQYGLDAQDDSTVQKLREHLLS
jgi:MoxR-like ATPase